MSKEIILASGSENRKMLLSSLGLPFKVQVSNIDEDAIEEEDPIIRVEKIARAKAHAVAREAKGLIIAADTFAVYNNRVYQKPKTINEARHMLMELSGKDGQSITGICILDTETGSELVDHRIVDMHCNNITETEINLYIQTKPVTEWAATYNPLDELSSKIFVPVGTYTYKIAYYGLPVDIVSDAVEKIGFQVDLSKFKS